MEKLCFTKQNIAFERKSLVLLSKTLLFGETQDILQNTKKTQKTKDSSRIRMVLGGGHGFLSEALVFLVFSVFLVF